MREIKFRYAFKHKEFKDVSFYHFTLEEIEKGGLAKVLSSGMTENGYEIVSKDRYTGLKDKTDLEIYEGDIIKECTEGEEIWDGDGTIKKCPVGIVEWDYAGFNIRQIKKGLVDLKDDSKSELHLSKYDGAFEWDEAILEVIGNIHENPGLLKS